jgi:ribosomal protein L1
MGLQPCVEKKLKGKMRRKCQKMSTIAIDNEQLASIIDILGKHHKLVKVEPATLTQQGFCEFVGISKSSYFNYRRKGQGPVEMRIGNRVMISKESAANWIKLREQLRSEEQQQKLE